MLLVKKFKVTEMEMIVNLKEHSYPIYIEKNILKHANEKIKEIFKGKKIMIISDDQVYPLYGDDLTLNLEKDFKVNHIISLFLMEKNQNVLICYQHFIKHVQILNLQERI